MCENNFSHQRVAQDYNDHPNAYRFIWATVTAADKRQMQDYASTNNRAADP